MKYNLNQTREEIGKLLGYNISLGTLHAHKKRGYLRPHSIDYIQAMNRKLPMYTKKEINEYIGIYKTLLDVKKVKQHRSKIAS